MTRIRCGLLGQTDEAVELPRFPEFRGVLRKGIAGRPLHALSRLKKFDHSGAECFGRKRTGKSTAKTCGYLNDHTCGSFWVVVTVCFCVLFWCRSFVLVLVLFVWFCLVWFLWSLVQVFGEVSHFHDTMRLPVGKAGHI